MNRFVSRAGQQVAELAERSADGGRLSRGRALFRKGAVSDLSVGEGEVTASVRGSQGHRYDTSISTALAPPGVQRQVADDPDGRRSVDDLIDDGIAVCPREIDLGFGCDCPDWDEPCKHVVAVLLAFADRVDLDEAELLRWRGLTFRPVEPAPAPVEPAPARAEQAEDRSARLSRLEALLGDTVRRTEPTPTVLDPSMARFLGVGDTIGPIEGVDELEEMATGAVAAVTPLFTDVELGPLADLGPALAEAVAIIADRLDRTAPPRR